MVHVYWSGLVIWLTLDGDSHCYILHYIPYICSACVGSSMRGYQWVECQYAQSISCRDLPYPRGN